VVVGSYGFSYVPGRYQVGRSANYIPLLPVYINITYQRISYL
jgi:hypothetical protein